MLEKAKSADGFIAALDQSGGSTPKALRLYGIPDKVSYRQQWDNVSQFVQFTQAFLVICGRRGINVRCGSSDAFKVSILKGLVFPYHARR